MNDDSTARAAIVIPNGSTITTTAAPGTKVGTAKAQVSALALGGALLPLAGDIVVAPPGAVAPASQTGCIGPVAPQLTLLLVLQAAGQTINLPAYILPTSGAQTALGSTQLVFCLPPPDLPAPVGATFGAKFLSADLTLNGVIGPVVQGAWVAFWTPWNAGVGTVNTAATVVSPAAIAPGGITLSGRKVKGVKRLSGRVTQGGAGVATRVTILAGAKRLATVAAKANGTFSYAVPKRSKATTFRARAVVAGRCRTGCLHAVRLARRAVRQPDGERLHRYVGERPAPLAGPGCAEIGAGACGRPLHVAGLRPARSSGRRRRPPRRRRRPWRRTGAPWRTARRTRRPGASVASTPAASTSSSPRVT